MSRVGWMFQSTPLLRGATEEVVMVKVEYQGFNPRPSCEGRRARRSRGWRKNRFNPRPSCEGRRGVRLNAHVGRWFQSTPLLRGATYWLKAISFCFGVSIHAPLARGDGEIMTNWSIPTIVSIHAPLARGDEVAADNVVNYTVFQSTPLLRGATKDRVQTSGNILFQSTPLLRGATAACFD